MKSHPIRRLVRYDVKGLRRGGKAVGRGIHKAGNWARKK
jgi:hypothetical protein